MMDNIITAISLLTVFVLTYLSGYKLGHRQGYAKRCKEQTDQPVGVVIQQTRKLIPVKARQAISLNELRYFSDERKARIIERLAEDMGREMLKSGLLKIRAYDEHMLYARAIELEALICPPTDEPKLPYGEEVYK